MGKVILFSENDNVSANIENHNILSENKNELLGIILDSILFFKDNSVSIHHRNIQALATEIFKVKNNIALEIMKELSAPKMSSYDLRNNDSFKRRRVNFVWHGTESVSYLGPKKMGFSTL